ncbi:hypothetical protein [Dapis sp. BLCC M229]|uniref:hypothetical protein n=1 Tax=Dapis sp. BLCC M229 TaxID=3400188 RepID=UPI003CEAD12C
MSNWDICSASDHTKIGNELICSTLKDEVLSMIFNRIYKRVVAVAIARLKSNR